MTQRYLDSLTGDVDSLREALSQLQSRRARWFIVHSAALLALGLPPSKKWGISASQLLPWESFIVTNLGTSAEQVVAFYDGRGTAEQWLKEGKYTLHWTRLSCHRFVANQVRLALFVLAYNLGDFLRRLALPGSVSLPCPQATNDT